MTKIDRSLSEMYDVFAEHTRPPQQINFCSCCIRLEEIQRLLRAPVKTVSAERLGPYAYFALGTVGEPADYLYFLPRLLELALQDDDRIPTADDLITRLREKAWGDMAEGPRCAIQDFLLEAVRHCFDPERLSRLDEWFTAAAIGGCELNAIFAAIERSPSAVVEYYSSNIVQARKGKLTNFHWPSAESEQRKVIDWLTSDRVFQLVSKNSALY